MIATPEPWIGVESGAETAGARPEVSFRAWASAIERGYFDVIEQNIVVFTSRNLALKRFDADYFAEG